MDGQTYRCSWWPAGWSEDAEVCKSVSGLLHWPGSPAHRQDVEGYFLESLGAQDHSQLPKVPRQFLAGW